MSVRASSWAWEHSTSTGSAFLVLLALADHAGIDGGDAWPSVARLSRRCRIDERTVQRAIDRLVELGEVVIVKQSVGGRRSNRYRLTFATNGDTPANRRGSETPASTTETPASTTGNPGEMPGESLEPSENPPTPIASDGAPVRSAAHDGTHPNCRACGTNRRAAAAPPDPLARTAAAADALRDRAAAVAAGQACDSCDGTRWAFVLDGDREVTVPCPVCRGSGLRAS